MEFRVFLIRELVTPFCSFRQSIPLATKRVSSGWTAGKRSRRVGVKDVGFIGFRVMGNL